MKKMMIMLIALISCSSSFASHSYAVTNTEHSDLILHFEKGEERPLEQDVNAELPQTGEHQSYQRVTLGGLMILSVSVILKKRNVEGNSK